MNYIWDAIIKAKRKNISTSDLMFRKAKIYSPYMEMAMNYINYEIEKDNEEIEVNPFYRFGFIFNELFKPDDYEYTELKEELLNCMLHYINNMDIYTGMNKHEFMRLYIKKDIENGYFGESIKDKCHLFELDEQETIITQLINMYQTGSSIEVLRKAILGVFHDGYIYYNIVLKDEILIFAGIRELEKYIEKMNILIELFMPIDFNYKIYWSKHFGIIGNDELMKEGSVVLY